MCVCVCVFGNKGKQNKKIMMGLVSYSTFLPDMCQNKWSSLWLCLCDLFLLPDQPFFIPLQNDLSLTYISWQALMSHVSNACTLSLLVINNIFLVLKALWLPSCGFWPHQFPDQPSFGQWQGPSLCMKSPVLICGVDQWGEPEQAPHQLVNDIMSPNVCIYCTLYVKCR